MKVSLANLDEWLFKGLGGIINMLVRRVGLDQPFNKNCLRMVQNEVQRLVSVREQVDARQAKAKDEPTPFSVLDTWFIRSYEGINHWLDLRSREGPPMDSSNIDDLQKHVDAMQVIIQNERRRCKDSSSSSETA